MAASGDDKIHDTQMGLQHGGEMRSGSMFNNNSSSGSANLFGSGWDPLETFGGSSSAAVENHHQGLLHHSHQSGDFLPTIGSFGNGNFSEIANPFMNPNLECGAQRISEENYLSSAPNRRDKKRGPNLIKNGQEDSSENMSEQDEKKQKTEHSKQMGKQAKDNSDSGGASKENYIHVRAKRGQATNSHSLAERVRREKISERMKLLQDLVPGCNKITGKAVMLDEIINYVQSLQQQVEFLSMKLATVNPELNVDLNHILSKDGSVSNHGFVTGLTSSQHYPQGSLRDIPTTTPFHPIHPQPVWDNDLHNLLQMGFDPNPGINNLGPNGNF